MAFITTIIFDRPTKTCGFFAFSKSNIADLTNIENLNFVWRDTIIQNSRHLAKKLLTMLIYSCVRQKNQKPKHFCAPFPLHIAYRSFSAEYPWFCMFFLIIHPNNCFHLWNVFHGRDRKTPYTTMHQITHDRYFT